MSERFGRYELLRRLGQGGMGEVFLARLISELPAPPRLVVVKRTLPHLAGDPLLTTRFLHEAKAAAHVHHPNVAQVFELGAEAGRLFLVMEYVPGVALTALAQGPRLEPALGARLLADAAHGLHAAHVTAERSGRPLELAHGDVSPGNLLVDTDGILRIIDFGLATMRATRAEGSHGGTYEYQAPEQALEGVVDARTDQFSLGVVAFELLSGQRLFAGGSDVSTLEQVVACRVPPLALAWPGAPARVAQLVDRMLSRAPQRRWPSCAEVAEGFELAARAGGPPAALREALAQRVRALLPTQVVEPTPGAPPRPPLATPLSARAPTSEERTALAQLATLSPPLTVEQMERALAAGGLPAPLDVLQGLTELGALRRLDDTTFELVTP
jgi:serine/threonine-protein kinase